MFIRFSINTQVSRQLVVEYSQPKQDGGLINILAVEFSCSTTVSFLNQMALAVIFSSASYQFESVHNQAHANYEREESEEPIGILVFQACGDVALLVAYLGLAVDREGREQPTTVEREDC